jgi:hypothetical protein
MEGVGSLWLDGQLVLSDVRYEVIEQNPRPGSVLRRIFGRIDIDLPTGLQLMSLPIGPNSDMQLHMADGRRWLCNLQSSDGTLSNRGGFVTP